MWALLGLAMMLVSLIVAWPKLGMPYSTHVKVFLEKFFFKGEDMHSADFRYSHENVWFQAPAAITGFLEWMPGSGILHFVELLVFVGLYAWTKHRKTSQVVSA